MSPPLLTYALARLAAAVIEARISSATAPATAAIGVMKLVGSEGRDRRMHALRNRTLQEAAVRMSGHTQQREFVTQLVQ